MEREVRIDGRTIRLTHLDKVLFPQSGLTKGDLVDYYRHIAETALPHYRDRPLTMHRWPDGLGSEGFFQKHIPDYFPDWIDRVEMTKEDGTVTHVVANDAASLVYLANQGCTTLHVALARRDSPHHPDRMIFDLDPTDNDFGKVRDAARWLRDRLDALGVVPFVQTTGSRGLHVVVPLDRSADFDAVKAVSHRISAELAERHPDSLTVEQRKDRRGRRVFLDYLRNAYAQTAVAPYSLRAREGAPLAAPLDWDELGSADLGPRSYTIGNIFRRLGQRRDPWAGIDASARPLPDLPERSA
ncbi:MAG TPA: non-homologous end-joining DNA ligase [Alphaproteobacteria bacterium]|nr:non-homologous end-joining DNA ligase [Alphaproteobacteria bacterium]